MTVSLRIRKGVRHVDAVTWVVSSFDDPVDIMLYDQRTMNRLMRKYYKSSKVKDKRINITEVLAKKEIGKSNLTLDDKKRPDSSSN